MMHAVASADAVTRLTTNSDRVSQLSQLHALHNRTPPPLRPPARPPASRSHAKASKTYVVPVELKTTSKISSVCTSMVLMHLPVATSNSLMVLSIEPDTTMSEVKLKDEEEISPS